MGSDLLEDAWDALRASIVRHEGRAVGTVAAKDADADPLNYDQVFTRDFAVSAVAFLLNGQTEIVKNFLTAAVDLQSKAKELDCFRPGEGLMPASFKVDLDGSGNPVLSPDFGEKAIARVAPVDSGLWWLYLLRAYGKISDDRRLARQPEFQKAIRMILDLSLTARFDMFPTLFVPDGSFMIDRRMGVYGYPLDIQALFYVALRSARELLVEESENATYLAAVRDRLRHLTSHTLISEAPGRLNKQPLSSRFPRSGALKSKWAPMTWRGEKTVNLIFHGLSYFNLTAAVESRAWGLQVKQNQSIPRKQSRAFQSRRCRPRSPRARQD